MHRILRAIADQVIQKNQYYFTDAWRCVPVRPLQIFWWKPSLTV